MPGELAASARPSSAGGRIRREGEKSKRAKKINKIIESLGKAQRRKAMSSKWQAIMAESIISSIARGIGRNIEA